MEKNKFLQLNPMLLHEVFEPFDSKDYLFEIKFDGMRALILIDNGNIIIKSRRGVILNNIYPELLTIKNMSKDKCIFDGEIVLFLDGKPSFSKLQERARLKNKNRIEFMQNNFPVTFICFDILYQKDDITHIPLLKRKEILNKYKESDVFVKSKCYKEAGINLFKAIQKEELEGIIAKKKDSIYTYGTRTKDWIKIKNFKIENFYVCGYIETKNKNVVSAILGEKINNKYHFVGKVLLSYKNSVFNHIKKEKVVDNYLINCEEDACYIKPKYKLKINYMERTKNNMLRQPFVKR